MKAVSPSAGSASDPGAGRISPDPAGEYRDRLGQRRSTHQALSARDARMSYVRLVVFGVFLLLLILAWRGSLSFQWLVAPVAVFGWL
ncbi:MAG TPA: hypothetical protein VIX63_15285, partial [Vicinamibacterales bacterium]